MPGGQVHRFELHGSKMALDVNSGAVHEVDQLMWELLGLGPDHCQADELAILGSRYTTAEVAEAMGEMAELIQREWLFATQSESPLPLSAVGDPLRAICLNVAHACNINCTYCFADRGTYGGHSALMPLEVACQAVDLLIRMGGSRTLCEVDFFGGEPLLNWPVVKDCIAYAQEAGSKAGKRFTFTLTTNAMLLTPEIMDELDRCEVSLILSLDGRPPVHNAMRSGSFTAAEKGIRALLARRAPDGIPAWEHGAAQGVSGRGAYAVVRGTYTAQNLDFATDALYLADEVEAPHLSIEPVIARPEEPYALQEHHLPQLNRQYEELAFEIDRRRREGRSFTFHHFAVESEAGPCLLRRAQGCGAGVQYLAVTPEGDLYPCHQFVGREPYRLGNVRTGILQRDLQERLAGCHIYSKQGCGSCWARYYCSGGCHANADLLEGDIFLPDRLGCALTKKRIECGLWLRARAAADSL